MKKKKFEFPSAFTVLVIILILAAALTYLIPSGRFSKLTYSKESNEFMITDENEKVTVQPATQEVLDKLNINLSVNKFTEEIIKKPIAIPGTYKRIPQSPQGIVEIIKSPVAGVADSVDIVIFVLILGGVIGIINKMGAFDAGIAALSKKTKGKEFVLVTLIFSLITLGGTTFGMSEETIAFYPILMPIFLASGFDAMTCIAAISLGSTIGTMFSTVNPFSTVIASNAAGISFTEGLTFRIVCLILASIITIVYIYRYTLKVKKDRTKSVVYDQEEEIHEKFLGQFEKSLKSEFTMRKKLCLTIFGLAFPIMIWGVSTQGWWFGEMSSLFLAVGIIIMFLSGLPEKKIYKFLYKWGCRAYRSSTYSRTCTCSKYYNGQWFYIRYIIVLFKSARCKHESYSICIISVWYFFCLRVLYSIFLRTCSTFNADYGTACRYSWSFKRNYN